MTVNGKTSSGSINQGQITNFSTYTHTYNVEWVSPQKQNELNNPDLKYIKSYKTNTLVPGVYADMEIYVNGNMRVFSFPQGIRKEVICVYCKDQIEMVESNFICHKCSILTDTIILQQWSNDCTKLMITLFKEK